MIVMGGIIGAGIFTNPYVVAQQVHTPLLILGAWTVGGLIALAGAFIYAELSSQVTESGGHYVYLREAMHPLDEAEAFAKLATGDGKDAQAIAAEFGVPEVRSFNTLLHGRSARGNGYPESVHDSQTGRHRCSGDFRPDGQPPN